MPRDYTTYGFGGRNIIRLPAPARRRCDGCRQPFTPIRRYHRYCSTCWRYDTYRSAVEAFLQGEL